MTIGIDARLYGPKWGGGGLGRYVEELVTELQQIDTKNRYVLFLKPENFDACTITNKNFRKVKVNAHWYTFKEQLAMPRAIKKAKVNLMHYPHWNVPLGSDVPFVVTIHDLILLEDPGSAKATTLGPILYGLKRLGFIRVLKHAVHQSKAIIAVSQYTKGSILNHFDVSPDKIHTVYEGVSLLHNRLSASPTSVIPVIAHQPYFLYVGSAYPHKNLESLLHAFSFFVQEHPEVTLVLVGRDDSFYKKLHQEVIEIGIPEGRVVFPGFVPDAALAALYEHAALYLYPSRIEGFGLPPLEAMQFGTPVAAARSSSLPEVLGDAAIYFDPDNIEEMVEVMEKSIGDGTRKEERGKRIEQTKKYSWNTMAKETLALYEQFGG